MTTEYEYNGHVYHVGDEVMVRSFDDLRAEVPIRRALGDRHICLDGRCMQPAELHICGTTVVIRDFLPSLPVFNTVCGYELSLQAVEPITSNISITADELFELLINGG